jgi:small subunit ribosomal protein S17
MARQNFIGLVVSQGKMNKTVKVQVERKTFNRLINKEIMKRTNYLVHDEGNIAREGDIVRIEACRPLSAKKHFAIAEIRKNKGSQFAKYDDAAKQQVLLEENIKAKEFLDRRARTEAEIASNSSLISDLSFVAKGVKTPEGELSFEDATKITEIKEKYGIKSWPPQREVLELEIQSLREKIRSLQESIEFVDPVLSKLMEEEYQSRVDAVLEEVSKKEPQELKKNVKKNLLRKFLLKNPELAREKFRDVIEQVKSL